MKQDSSVGIVLDYRRDSQGISLISSKSKILLSSPKCRRLALEPIQPPHSVGTWGSFSTEKQLEC